MYVAVVAWKENCRKFIPGFFKLLQECFRNALFLDYAKRIMEGFFKDTSKANCGRFNDESIIFHGSFITTFKKLHGLKTLGFFIRKQKNTSRKSWHAWKIWNGQQSTSPNSNRLIEELWSMIWNQTLVQNPRNNLWWDNR